MYLLGSLEFGKSTITNKILDEERAGIGDISQKNKRGKNTTTNTTLYEIEKGAFILDTPGFQVIDIFEIEKANLSEFFIEFKNEINKCEFVGCTHIKEENCGIKKALEDRKNPKITI